jgi:hypothetical protein
VTTKPKAKKHDHRQSLWIIANGDILWCYQCGAWRLNEHGRQYKWHRTSGIGGPNPAMKTR